jgi:TonB family protein
VKRHRARRPLWAGLLLACPTAFANDAAQAPAFDAEASLKSALQAPLSAGSVLLLVEHAHSPEARARVLSSLTHADASVRAAAARVANVWSVPEFAAQLREALGAETDSGAGVEQIRAIAGLADAADEAALRAAAARLGESARAALAELQARTRGPDVVASPALLDELGVPQEQRAALLLLATRGQTPGLTRAASRAVAAADRDLLEDVLAVSRKARNDPDLGIFAAAVMSEASDIRALSYFHLATVDPKRFSEPLRHALRRSPESSETSQHGSDAAFAYEILMRAGGRKPREDGGWIARARGSEPLLFPADLQRRSDLLARLTPAERAALRSRSETASDDAEAPVPRAPAGSLIRTVRASPLAWFEKTVSAAGCDPPGQQGWAAALIRYAPTGRVARIAHVAGLSELSVGCVRAARALLAASLEPNDFPTPEGAEQLVLVALDRDSLSCDTQPGTRVASPVSPGRGKRSIQEPKKVRNFAPVYPQAAREARVQGIVVLETIIGPSGCIGEIRVLIGAHPTLSLAALRAVQYWRYTPTLLDGVPVPVIMTVTVNFKLS